MLEARLVFRFKMFGRLLAFDFFVVSAIDLLLVEESSTAKFGSRTSSSTKSKSRGASSTVYSWNSFLFRFLLEVAISNTDEGRHKVKEVKNPFFDFCLLYNFEASALSKAEQRAERHGLAAVQGAQQAGWAVQRYQTYCRVLFKNAEKSQ